MVGVDEPGVARRHRLAIGAQVITLPHKRQIGNGSK